jgi:hypothetical protein
VLSSEQPDPSDLLVVVRVGLPPTGGPAMIHYRDLGVLALVISQDDISEEGARAIERSYRLRRNRFPERIMTLISDTS